MHILYMSVIITVNSLKPSVFTRVIKVISILRSFSFNLIYSQSVLAPKSQNFRGYREAKESRIFLDGFAN